MLRLGLGNNVKKYTFWILGFKIYISWIAKFMVLKLFNAQQLLIMYWYHIIKLEAPKKCIITCTIILIISSIVSVLKRTIMSIL